MARLREHYVTKVVPALTKEFGYKNPMAVPKIEKISINIGLGEATQNAKLMDGAVNELTQIAGQKPVITKAKKSIAQFKLREGMPIGVKVTLRRERMYEFLDRFITIALPRVRDFRGLNPKSFDGRGKTLFHRLGFVHGNRLEPLPAARIFLRQPFPPVVLLYRTLLRHLGLLAIRV